MVSSSPQRDMLFTPDPWHSVANQRREVHGGHLRMFRSSSETLGWSFTIYGC